MTDGGKFINKMADKKISYEQFCDPSYRRAEQMKVKSEAVWAIFHELGGLINVSRLAREYFHKSQSWLAQKINGHSVRDKEKCFTSEEYAQLAGAFRDIARRLEEYAKNIEDAK